MKEEILKIINSSERNLNATEILDKIKSNTTAEDLRSLLDELDSLCKEGLIRTCSGNTYKENDLIVGVLDVHEKGKGIAGIV